MSLDFQPSLKYPALHPALERAQWLAPWAMLAMLFIVALVQRHLVFGSSDVTWLLTANEKMLDGHPLYSEVLETNPPIAPLAYLPAVLIGRALGIAAERVTDALVFLAAAVSLGVAVAMLRGSAAARRVDGWAMALLAFADLTVLPAQTFGQREHIALIAILPGLAAASLRAHLGRPPRWALAVAGLGSAVTLAFKPYFVVAVAAGPLVAALRQRSVRVLLAPENWIAGVALLVYAAGSALLFPAYFTEVLPLVRDVYLKLHHSFPDMLLGAPMYIFYAALITTWLLGREHRDTEPNIAILASAASGFALDLDLLFKLMENPVPGPLPRISLRIDKDTAKSGFDIADQLRNAGYIVKVYLGGRGPTDTTWELVLKKSSPQMVLTDLVKHKKYEIQNAQEVMEKLV